MEVYCAQAGLILQKSLFSAKKVPVRKTTRQLQTQKFVDRIIDARHTMSSVTDELQSILTRAHEYFTDNGFKPLPKITCITPWTRSEINPGEMCYRYLVWNETQPDLRSDDGFQRFITRNPGYNNILVQTNKQYLLYYK